MTLTIQQAIATARTIESQATEGPWRWRDFGGTSALVTNLGCHAEDGILYGARIRNERGLLVAPEPGMPNPDFITHARNTHKLLLDALDAALARAEKGHDSFCLSDPTFGNRKCDCGHDDLQIALQAFADHMGKEP